MIKLRCAKDDKRYQSVERDFGLNARSRQEGLEGR
jgi:hypothetical protein